MQKSTAVRLNSGAFLEENNGCNQASDPKDQEHDQDWDSRILTPVIYDRPGRIIFVDEDGDLSTFRILGGSFDMHTLAVSGRADPVFTTVGLTGIVIFIDRREGNEAFSVLLLFHTNDHGSTRDQRTFPITKDCPESGNEAV